MLKPICVSVLIISLYGLFAITAGSPYPSAWDGFAALMWGVITYAKLMYLAIDVVVNRDLYAKYFNRKEKQTASNNQPLPKNVIKIGKKS